MSTKQYCTNCRKHTEHRHHANMYADQCVECNNLVNTLMRLRAQTAAIGQKLNAPDGTPAQIVENTPDTITFFIPSGEYQGYYDYDKRTKQKQIRAAL